MSKKPKWSELKKMSYRDLQQLALAFDVPRNLKKIYLQEVLYHSFHGDRSKVKLVIGRAKRVRRENAKRVSLKRTDEPSKQVIKQKMTCPKASWDSVMATDSLTPKRPARLTESHARSIFNKGKISNAQKEKGKKQSNNIMLTPQSEFPCHKVLRKDKLENIENTYVCQIQNKVKKIITKYGIKYRTGEKSQDYYITPCAKPVSGHTPTVAIDHPTHEDQNNDGTTMLSKDNTFQDVPLDLSNKLFTGDPMVVRHIPIDTASEENKLAAKETLVSPVNQDVVANKENIKYTSLTCDGESAAGLDGMSDYGMTCDSQMYDYGHESWGNTLPSIADLFTSIGKKFLKHKRPLNSYVEINNGPDAEPTDTDFESVVSQVASPGLDAGDTGPRAPSAVFVGDFVGGITSREEDHHDHTQLFELRSTNHLNNG